jgi:hypothetical protein
MPEHYLIAADSREVALFSRQSGGGAPLMRLALAEPTPVALADACAGVLEQCKVQSGSGTVWLGSAWARLLMLEWPEASLDREEQDALLRYRWADVLPDPESWALLLVDRGSPRLGVAIREGLAEVLAEQLARFRLRARSLLPAVCGALDAAGIRDGAVLLDEGDRMVSARCESGHIVALSVHRQIDGEWSDEGPDLAVTAGGGAPLRLAGQGGGASAWGVLWR